jgi:hypothetical protein
MFIGAWRSLVAHWHGVSGVGGSNPLAPTIDNPLTPPFRKGGMGGFEVYFLSHHGRTIEDSGHQ